MLTLDRAAYLTLEIARFSLIFGHPKRCRNHFFCSIISLAYTEPLKEAPKKEGPKTSPLTELYQKNAPPDLLLTLSFFHRKRKQGKNRVFRFSCSRFSAHFSLIGVFCSPPKNYSQGSLELRKVGQRIGQNKGFFGCLATVFFWWWCFSKWFPYARVFSSCTFFFAHV